MNEGRKMYDIAIVGGGAAGMAAAVTARIANRKASIVILEKNDMLGKKLYATGNGRCNLANKDAYGCYDVLFLFEEIGMMCMEDLEGRFYPSSQMAEDAVFFLESFIRSHHIDVMTKTPVDGVEPLADGGFAIKSGVRTVHARQVLLAPGGKAGPMYGTTGDGYIMARHLGYRVSPVYPALTGIETNVKSLKGVRTRALVRLYRQDDLIYEEYGQVQFTDYGMSGIVVMNASSLISLRGGLTFDDYELVLDFAPERIDAELNALLGHRMEKGFAPLRGFVPAKLAAYLQEHADHVLEDPEVDNNEQKVYFDEIRESHFQVTGVHGWKTAQCTCGGVTLDQIVEKTMASRLHEGLYFAGEILNECGPCGGFNLTQAFFTGLKAGRAMAIQADTK